jgi:cupin 2 domain-containing protein
MGSTSKRGRLTDRVPPAGEEFHDLARVGGARIEHIGSSATPDHGEQVQPWDEWVLVVAGGARLEVGGELVALGPREWLLIPAGTVHRVVATEHGTHWIAVHGPGPARLGEEPADDAP